MNSGFTLLELLITIACLVAVAGISFVARHKGRDGGIESFRMEAVNAGVGRWVITNFQTGDVGFEWITPEVVKSTNRVWRTMDEKGDTVGIPPPIKPPVAPNSSNFIMRLYDEKGNPVDVVIPVVTSQVIFTQTPLLLGGK